MISCRQSQQKRQPQTVQFMRLQLPSLIFIMKALQRGQTLMSSASADGGKEMRWDGWEQDRTVQVHPHTLSQDCSLSHECQG